MTPARFEAKVAACQGGRTFRSDVAIHHFGYNDASHRRQKLLRDLRLLELDCSERPVDPLVLFRLGWARHLLGQSAEAAAALSRRRPEIKS